MLVISSSRHLEADDAGLNSNQKKPEGAHEDFQASSVWMGSAYVTFALVTICFI